MKTRQTLSGSANPILNLIFPRELVDIAMLSALGWSISLLVAIYLVSADPGYLGSEIATLTAFP